MGSFKIIMKKFYCSQFISSFRLLSSEYISLLILEDIYSDFYIYYSFIVIAIFRRIPEIGIVKKIYFVFLKDGICNLPNIYNLLMTPLFS